MEFRRVLFRSVLIVTQKGTCDRAYRYPVKIDNGSVGYAGSASFTVSGKVGDNGAVTRRVARRAPLLVKPEKSMISSPALEAGLFVFGGPVARNRITSARHRRHNRN